MKKYTRSGPTQKKEKKKEVGDQDPQTGVNTSGRLHQKARGYREPMSILTGNGGDVLRDRETGTEGLDARDRASLKSWRLGLCRYGTHGPVSWHHWLITKCPLIQVSTPRSWLKAVMI